MTEISSQNRNMNGNTIPGIDPVRTGQQIRRYMNLRGMSVEDVKEYLSLGCVQSVYHWLQGKSLPSLDNLYALSICLHVPMDVLVVGRRVPYVEHNHIEALEAAEDRRLLYYYRRLQKSNAA